MTIIVLLIVAAVAFFFRPLLDGVVFGVFFAYVTRPIKDFLRKYTKYAPMLATFCILLPVIAIFSFAAIELRNQISWFSDHGNEALAQVNAALEALGVPAELVVQLNDVLMNISQYAFAFAATVPIRETFTSLLLLGTNALVSIFVCYYLLKDGDRIISTIMSLTPARFQPAVSFFTVEADRILFGIYIGTFYTALFIATMSAVLFFLFSVPYLALCTAFVFIAAMVPILSGMMVFIPVAAYMYIYRDPAIGILFFLSAIIFVYLPPDFLIRPYLINRASNIHPLLIIMSFIGGGLAGGLSGFFAAPLAVGLLIAVYRTYLKYGEECK
ncbi:AI-2E family transporter [Methanocella arvoryzae]|uniref:AI-2E family transporter n=1 Tax=Methanocella arvoryzae TaxID=1175445 RepID=UPI000323243A|nr:AI-2E family transporter [Methanocella arvoryzae]